MDLLSQRRHRSLTAVEYSPIQDLGSLNPGHHLCLLPNYRSLRGDSNVRPRPDEQQESFLDGLINLHESIKQYIPFRRILHQELSGTDREPGYGSVSPPQQSYGRTKLV